MQVGLHDVSAGLGRQSGEHGLVGDGREGGDAPTASEDHPVDAVGPPDDRLFDRAPVGGLQPEWLPQLVAAGMQHHLDAAGSIKTGDPADRVAGGRRCGQRPIAAVGVGRGQSARPGVVAIDRHVDGRGRRSGGSVTAIGLAGGECRQCRHNHHAAHGVHHVSSKGCRGEPGAARADQRSPGTDWPSLRPVTA